MDLFLPSTQVSSSTPTSLRPHMLLPSVVPVKAYLTECPVRPFAIALKVGTPSPISLVDPILPPILPVRFLEWPQGFGF